MGVYVENEYLPIMRESIRLNVEVPFDCFFLLGLNQRIIHFIHKGGIPLPETIERLASNNVTNLYIKSDDLETYKEYLNSFLNSTEGKEVLEKIQEQTREDQEASLVGVPEDMKNKLQETVLKYNKNYVVYKAENNQDPDLTEEEKQLLNEAFATINSQLGESPKDIREIINYNESDAVLVLGKYPFHQELKRLTGELTQDIEKHLIHGPNPHEKDYVRIHQTIQQFLENEYTLINSQHGAQETSDSIKERFQAHIQEALTKMASQHNNDLINKIISPLGRYASQLSKDYFYVEGHQDEAPASAKGTQKRTYLKLTAESGSKINEAIQTIYKIANLKETSPRLELKNIIDQFTFKLNKAALSEKNAEGLDEIIIDEETLTRGETLGDFPKRDIHDFIKDIEEYVELHPNSIGILTQHNIPLEERLKKLLSLSETIEPQNNNQEAIELFKKLVQRQRQAIMVMRKRLQAQGEEASLPQDDASGKIIYKEQIDPLLAKNKKLEEEVSRLSQLQSEHQQLKDQEGPLKEENEHLKEKLHRIEEQLNISLTLNKTLESEKQQTEASQKTMEQKLDEFETFVKKNVDYISNLEGENKTFVESMNEVKKRMEDLSFKNEKLEELNTDSQGMFKKQETEISTYQNIVNDLRNSLALKEKEILTISEKIRAIEAHESGTDALKETVNLILSEKEKLINKQQEQMDDLRERIKTLNKEIMTIQQNHNNVVLLRSKLGEKLAEMEIEKKNFIKKEDSLNTKILLLTNLNAQARKTVVKMSTMVEKMRAEKNEMASQKGQALESKQQLNDSITQLKKSVDLLTQKEHSYVKAISKLTEKNVELQKQYAMETQKNFELDKKYRFLRNRVDSKKEAA